MSNDRIERNKKILSQANLPGQNKQSYMATGKYTTQKKKRLKSNKTAKDKFYASSAWKWFSKYVLMYYSLDGEVVQCCTCKTYKRVNDKKMHVGHWIKVFNANSSNYSVAFEFTNVMGQCLQCNKFMGGRETDMMEILESVHGEDEIKRLRRLSKQPFHLDDYTLKKISDEYRNKFYEILKERGWKNPWKK